MPHMKIVICLVCKAMIGGRKLKELHVHLESIQMSPMKEMLEENLLGLSAEEIALRPVERISVPELEEEGSQNAF